MVNSDIQWEQDPVTQKVEDVPSQEGRYRWVMLALAWLAYFIFGIVTFSLAPLATPIIEDLGISYSQMGIILGAWPLTYVVVATIGGAIVDRWGIRKSIFTGLLFIGLSEVLRYFAGGFGTMFFCVAMFGLGGPMLSIGCPKTISLWFTGKERGTAVGIYTTGVWVGGAISLSTINSVVMPLTGYSWRLTFVCFGLLAFGAALLWWFIGRDIKVTEATKGTSITRVFGSLISTRNIQLVLIMGFLTFAVAHGFGGWLPKILEVSGLSPAMAGIASSIPIWVSIPYSLVLPRLVAPHSRGRAVAIMCFLVSVSVLTVVITSGIPLVISLIFFGLSHTLLPFLVLILMDLPEVGSRYMGAASGIFFCISELGGFAGPLMIGAIKDLAGGFLGGAYLLAGISLVRVAIALFIKTKPAREIAASS